MTAIVGIFCSDGVVVGTDSSSTAVASGGLRTIEHPTEKLHVINGQIVIAGTGSVGLGQRFQAVVEKAWRDRKMIAFQNGQRQKVTDICRNLSSETIDDFIKTKVQHDKFAALVAFPFEGKLVLCEFSEGFQPELKTEQMWFCSMGITQQMTDPFLALMREIFWPTGQPSVREAMLAVTWTLDHAIAFNTGGVNGPVRIVVLENYKNTPKARFSTDEEMSGHRSWIENAKRRLSESLRARGDVAPPPIPRAADIVGSRN